MSASSRLPRDLSKALAGLALIATTFGAVCAALWGAIAGLWTFSTKDYGHFSIVIAVAIILIGTPFLSFRVASKGKHRLAMALTMPALFLYAAVLLALFSR